MAAFSSAVSQRACSGPSGSKASTTRPSTTAGSPSMMNSHCHPARPKRPWVSRIQADKGAPSALEMGTAAMNSAT